MSVFLSFRIWVQSGLSWSGVEMLATAGSPALRVLKLGGNK